ncbi:MAG: type II toxin-antitoxin system HicA family toxin [Magnetococcales bacterium]|nr:type II toxin-antitoxin system HicA family toxin [Magnetococcales bacterium]
MKRRDLIRHLEKFGCELSREGARHTVFIHREKRKSTTVPRHNEINDNLAAKICKDLDIPKPDSIH